ncbi:MAG: hypothetical protein GKR90_11200 [Pseudomonadales bacterium]|nr:hypothetical protein [Pseudomonadales bacterium]
MSGLAIATTNINEPTDLFVKDGAATVRITPGLLLGSSPLGELSPTVKRTSARLEFVECGAGNYAMRGLAPYELSCLGEPFVEVVISGAARIQCGETNVEIGTDDSSGSVDFEFELKKAAVQKRHTTQNVIPFPVEVEAEKEEEEEAEVKVEANKPKELHRVPLKTTQATPRARMKPPQKKATRERSTKPALSSSHGNLLENLDNSIKLGLVFGAIFALTVYLGMSSFTGAQPDPRIAEIVQSPIAPVSTEENIPSAEVIEAKEANQAKEESVWVPLENAPIISIPDATAKPSEQLIAEPPELVALRERALEKISADLLDRSKDYQALHELLVDARHMLERGQTIWPEKYNAIELIKRVLEIDPENQRALRLIPLATQNLLIVARDLYEAGYRTDARTLVREVLEIDEENQTAQEHWQEWFVKASDGHLSRPSSSFIYDIPSPT